MIFDEEPTDDKGSIPNPNTPPPAHPEGITEGERLRDEAHGHLQQHRQQIMRDGGRH